MEKWNIGGSTVLNNWQWNLETMGTGAIDNRVFFTGSRIPVCLKGFLSFGCAAMPFCLPAVFQSAAK